MILQGMPIQNNSDKAVGEKPSRKNRPDTQAEDKKFNTYLERLLNNKSPGYSSKKDIGKRVEEIRETKDEDVKVDGDEFLAVEGDLFFLLALLNISGERKEMPVENDLGSGEGLNLDLSSEELDSETEKELSSLLAKLKHLKIVLENYQGESSFSSNQAEEPTFETEYSREFNRLMAELEGKGLTGIEVKRALGRSEGEGFRDLIARLTRLEIRLQNLLEGPESSETKNLINNTDHDLNLSTSDLDNDLPGIQENVQLENSKKHSIENSIRERPNSSVKNRDTDRLFIFSQNEVEEINTDEKMNIYSYQQEKNSQDSHSFLTEFANNSEHEEEVEFEARDNQGQDFTVNEDKGVSRNQYSSRTAELSQLKQSDIYEQIDKQIQSVIRSGQNKIEIQLEPETLGKVNLKLELENGSVSVYFNVDNNIVKEHLEQNLVLLKQNFLKLGYNVDHIQVETEEQQTTFQQGQYQQSSPEEQGYNMNGQKQDSQYDGLSPGELYQLFLEEEKTLGNGTDNSIWRWYQYKYGSLSINMNYLA